MNQVEFYAIRHALRCMARGLAFYQPMSVWGTPNADPAGPVIRTFHAMMKDPYAWVYDTLHAQRGTECLRLPLRDRIDMRLNVEASKDACEAHRVKSRLPQSCPLNPIFEDICNSIKRPVPTPEPENWRMTPDMERAG